MGQFFDEIPENIIPWIQKQQMFWVATAPLTPSGHVNVSPKGYDDTFFIIDSHRVWYEDLSGSGMSLSSKIGQTVVLDRHTFLVECKGNETISHLRENGRITIMFNAFEGPPRIVRLFGTGDYTSSELHVTI
jgi:hypothetical protein